MVLLLLLMLMIRMKLCVMMSAKRCVVSARRAQRSDWRDTAGGSGREWRRIDGGQIRRRRDGEGREIERERGALHQIFREALARGLKVATVRRWIAKGRR
jgi:hypothetical protein